MIGRLTGRIVRRLPSELLVDVSGVGYRVLVPLSTFYELPSDDAPVCLEILTLVREDAITLYGFATGTEKAVFEALLSVSGVGPKVGLTVLSGLAPAEIARAIESGDAPRLKTIPGVGRKLAERIVLELKEKIGRIGMTSGAPRADEAGDGDEAESALTHLGYGAAEAREALDRARKSTAGAPLPLETLLKEALRLLSR